MKTKITFWDILFFTIIIILLIMISTRIFGHSATEIQIYLSFVSGILLIGGYILKLMSAINDNKLSILKIEHNMQNSFSKVREDMEKIKIKLKIL